MITLKVKNTTAKVKWSSSNKSVATVNSGGDVIAKKAGKTKIIAAVSGRKYTCKVSVPKQYISNKSISLNIVESKTLIVNGISMDDEVFWFSDDEDIATVTENGKIVAKKSGTTTIYASLNSGLGKTYKCKVTVFGNPVIQIPDRAETTIKEGDYDDEIMYISDRSVEYNKDYDEQRVFFSFKLEDKETRVWTNGKAKIRIVNMDGTTVYSKTHIFGKSDFGTWTNEKYGERYLCCIHIPNSSIEKSKLSIGKLYLGVEFSNGTFDEQEYSIRNLPTDNIKNNYVSVSGNVTWYYNKYKGNVSDTGAIVLLISKSGLAKEMPDLTSYVNWKITPIINSYNDYGIYCTEVDGKGSFVFNKVLCDEYLVFIISNNTTSGDAFNDKTAYQDQITKSVKPYVNDNNASMLGEIVGYNKYTVKSVSVEKGLLNVFSHDFGVTYI